MAAAPPPTDRSPFFLTGDSHADLDRMTNACAPAPQGPVADAHRRVRTQLEALSTVVGRPALLLLEQAVDDLHYAGTDYRARTIALEETTRRLGNQVDDARSLAARLEEDLVRLQGPWLARYVSLLELEVSEGRREAIVHQVGVEQTPDPGVDPVRPGDAPDPGLPIVDDAGLAEGEMVWRRGDTLLATGRLNRVFGPIDQATEIAVGAVPYDAPQADDAEVAAAIDRAYADDEVPPPAPSD